MEKPFATADIQRFAEEAAESNGLAPGELDAAKIILPGTRRIITPKSAGQKHYIEMIAENEIVIGIGP
ncbi:MAG: PhoH family protein, partial [Gemmatimonadetes bacterium]|nr:PhoH family protein [Gemmatimonadota bacterium]NIS01355.1 PhoH family protein [Gemmatimonadota bacterium]NIT67089.1 PhoH family protein [Gemmatimonadota bacterium]NIU51903.1 PhoH family protein [Gemmatimonadota bacterium]NIV23881.1 PhoH family protein [Gemmatimonadota bacterium]